MKKAFTLLVCALALTMLPAAARAESSESTETPDGVVSLTLTLPENLKQYAYRLTATKNETEQRDNGWRMCECVNTFFKYALRTGKCERQTTILKELRRGDHYVKINSLSVSPDGGLLAVLLEENTVVLLDAHSGETVSLGHVKHVPTP